MGKGKKKGQTFADVAAILDKKINSLQQQLKNADAITKRTVEPMISKLEDKKSQLEQQQELQKERMQRNKTLQLEQQFMSDMLNLGQEPKAKYGGRMPKYKNGDIDPPTVIPVASDSLDYYRNHPQYIEGIGLPGDERPIAQGGRAHEGSIEDPKAYSEYLAALRAAKHSSTSGYPRSETRQQRVNRYLNEGSLSQDALKNMYIDRDYKGEPLNVTPPSLGRENAYRLAAPNARPGQPGYGTTARSWHPLWNISPEGKYSSYEIPKKKNGGPGDDEVQKAVDLLREGMRQQEASDMFQGVDASYNDQLHASLYPEVDGIEGMEGQIFPFTNLSDLDFSTGNVVTGDPEVDLGEPGAHWQAWENYSAPESTKPQTSGKKKKQKFDYRDAASMLPTIYNFMKAMGPDEQPVFRENKLKGGALADLKKAQGMYNTKEALQLNDDIFNYMRRRARNTAGNAMNYLGAVKGAAEKAKDSQLRIYKDAVEREQDALMSGAKTKLYAGELDRKQMNLLDDLRAKIAANKEEFEKAGVTGASKLALQSKLTDAMKGKDAISLAILNAFINNPSAEGFKAIMPLIEGYIDSKKDEA